MPLERTNPRRTITLDGFSFATGSIDLVHPHDAPLYILAAFVSSEDSLEQFEDSLEQFYAYNLDAGFITEDEFAFLTEMSTAETLELAEKIEEVMVEAGPVIPSAQPRLKPRDLSDDDEALVQKFNELLNGLSEAFEEGDSGEGDSEDPR